MYELGICIVGGIIGIIGTLLGQYFNTKIEIARDKEKESKQILKEKYKDFKKNYDTYKLFYPNILTARYKYILLPDIDLNKIKCKIEIFENVRNTYQDCLEKLFDVFQEDNYLYEKLISYNDLKLIFLKLSNINDNIKQITTIWKYVNELNKDKLLQIEDEYIKYANEIDNKLKELNNKFQEKIYKNIIC